MTCDLLGICYDANEPEQLAGFWAELLGREPSGTMLPLDEAASLRIRFVPTSQPKIGQNRIHLDLTSTSFAHQEQLVVRAIELGGEHIDIGQTPDEGHVVLADPEGNEFCVIEPDNRFLAGTGAIGAVNCDGTSALGHFWSAALGWPLVWDRDGETAIQSPHGGPKVTWSGQPLMTRHGRDRLRLEAASADGPVPAEVERLVALGANLIALDQDGWAVLADADGNEFTMWPPSRQAPPHGRPDT